jgi:DNA-binding NarL/FixJ family response regulator
MIRVLIVEDQTVVREGLVTMVGLGDGVEVAGAAADGEEGIRLVHELEPDVVLMDLRMPRLDGVEATRRICGEAAAPRVIVLTTYTDDESVFAALEAGAVGYLSKDAHVEDIERAIHTVTTATPCSIPRSSGSWPTVSGSGWPARPCPRDRRVAFPVCRRGRPTA